MIAPSRFSLLVPCLLLISLAGCSKEPSEEQLQADQELTNAKDLLEHGSVLLARPQLLSAFTLDQDLGRTARVADEERMLGDVYAAVAAYDSAITMYTQAAEDYKAVADRASARAMTLAIASLHSWMGDERKALTLCTESYRLAKVFGDDQGARDIEWDMLPLCRALDDTAGERRILADLLNYADAGGDVRLQARVHYERGLSLSARGEYAPAADALLRAFDLADQMRDSTLAATALLRLALAYDGAGNAKESFQAYTDGIRRADRMRGGQSLRMEFLTRVGNVYLRNGQYYDAGRFYRAALSSAVALQNKLAEGYLFIQLGHCSAGTSGEDARKNYEFALELFQSYSYAPGESYALLGRGMVSQRRGQLNDAARDLQEAVQDGDAWYRHRADEDLYEECERAFTGTGEGAPCDQAIALLLELGRYDEGFRSLEHRNGRTLYDVLSAARPETTNDALSGLLETFFHARALRRGAERRLEQLLSTDAMNKDVIAEVRAALENTGVQVRELAAQIVRMNPAYEPVVRIGDIGLPEVQALLSPGTVLLEHAATRRSLYALAISREKISVRVAPVGRTEELARVREFTDVLRRREAYADSSSSMSFAMDRRTRELGPGIYQDFIRPVEDDLASATKLYVVLPDGFPTLPFHALRRTALPGSEYLAERFQLSYLPSAKTLTLPRPVLTGVHDVAGIGFPGSTGWDVEYELRDIRAFFKEAKLYFNQRATLTTLQAEHADVLHLAIECRFHHQDPQNLAVVLSDGKSPDASALVPVAALFSLRGSPTIVLSALESERTAIHPSLPYIFLADGSGYVIMNTYLPSRKVKKSFGESFYTALMDGNTTPPVAFRTAQRDMIKNPETSAPGVWAPFFAWGY